MNQDQAVENLEALGVYVEQLEGWTLVELFDFEHIYYDEVTISGRIHEKVLKFLRPIKNLSLLLRATGISDEGLVAIGSLNDLVAANLRDTNITDGGLKHLSKSKKLEALILRGTRITDAGLDHLAKLSRLKLLDLVSCDGVTEIGIGRIREALPDCEITH